jgi:phage tail-like protein
MPEPEYGLTLRFKVVVDAQADLGAWTKCEGLGYEYDVQEIKEGGNNGYTHRLPIRVKNQNIRLTRPVDKDTRTVSTWIASMGTNPRRSSAVITVLDANGTTVFAWQLAGVYPIKWTGPTFDVGSTTVAMETLELVHNGMATS